eukprot:4386698-Ditylum_brightwellii.AAC.1
MDILTNIESQLPILLPEYDPALLKPISIYQCADWDETHPESIRSVSNVAWTTGLVLVMVKTK